MNNLSDGQALLTNVAQRLSVAKLQGADLEAILDCVLTALKCAAGTIHRFDPALQQLELIAHRGIPDAILPQVQCIPIGKGMAGLAALRRECVSVCNLQTDASGDVRPGAKQTGMEGAIAVPMLVAGEVRGVLGVAKPTAYEFTESEKNLLLQVAAMIGEHL